MSKFKANGFVLFCQQKGKNVPELSDKPLPELVRLLADDWSQLSDQEKQVFKDKAKGINGQRAPEPVPFDQLSVTSSSRHTKSSSKALEEMRKEELWAKIKNEFVAHDIRERVFDGLEQKKLADMRFLVLNMHVWTEEEVNLSGDLYVAEMSLVEFSIHSGITKVFHQLVHPGPLPIGIKGELKVYSDKFHRIWLDNEELQDDYEAIINQLFHIAHRKNGERGAGEGIECPYFDSSDDRKQQISNNCNLLPLFTMPDEMEKCEKGLKWLCSKAKVKTPFTMYPLTTLFSELLKTTTQNQDLVGDTLIAAESFLTEIIYLRNHSIICPYHDAIDWGNCAASKSIRESLIIINNCCKSFDVTPLRGTHYPWDVDMVNPELVVSSTKHDEDLCSSRKKKTMPSRSSRILQLIKSQSEKSNPNTSQKTLSDSRQTMPEGRKLKCLEESFSIESVLSVMSSNSAQSYV